MNVFEKLIYKLQITMETPTAFGWFHLMWIGIIIISLITLYLLKSKYNEKQLKTILLIYGIIAFILELLKQIIWSFNYDSINNIVSWDYLWYASPFQLCTMPIYICIIAGFLKKSKLRDSLLSFVAFFTILGSISTILMPTTCFVPTIEVNIHTMWLHCMSFVVSVYLIMSGEVKLKIKNVINGFWVFLSCTIIALLLNIVIYNSGVIGEETFNMFYISPYFISPLPVFNIIQENVPYIIYLIIYIAICPMGALIIFMLAKITKNIYNMLSKRSA